MGESGVDQDVFVLCSAINPTRLVNTVHPDPIWFCASTYSMSGMLGFADLDASVALHSGYEANRNSLPDFDGGSSIPDNLFAYLLTQNVINVTT